MDLCAACKQRVEDGSVVCPNCGTRLDLPGAFMQVIGWVIIAFSVVPFAIGEVTTTQRNYFPLALGCILLILGIVLVVTGKLRSKAAPPRTISETSESSPPAPPEGT